MGFAMFLWACEHADLIHSGQAGSAQLDQGRGERSSEPPKAGALTVWYHGDLLRVSAHRVLQHTAY